MSICSSKAVDAVESGDGYHSKLSLSVQLKSTGKYNKMLSLDVRTIGGQYTYQ